MNQQAKKAIQRARTRMLIDEPFFGALACNLKFVEDESLPTLATNGVQLRYNPDWVLSKPLNVLKAGVAHEVMHVALAHIYRLQNRNPFKWNMAGDYCINALLKESGMAIEKGWLLNRKYNGMTADAVYALLPDPPTIEILVGGDGDANGNGAAGSGENQDPDDHSRGCGGMLKPTKENGQTMSNPEQKIAATRAKVMIAQAAAVAKAAGNLPGNLEEFVKAILDPKIPWTRYIRRFLETATMADYSWMVPDRRYLEDGFALPSIDQEYTASGVLAIDTSASMSTEELQLVASELSGLLATVPLKELHILYVDTEVQDVITLTKEDLPLELNMKGRGGTRFMPAFDWVRENNINPDFFLYMTDMGSGDFPEQPPSYPVMWCTTYPGAHDAPFGEMIHMDLSVQSQ